MNEESNNHRIDPELEARIVALVMGEASAHEREQLDRMIVERPELAAFKAAIEVAHGWMRQVGAGEWASNSDDWKLSPQKRDAVLAVIQGETPPQKSPVNKPVILRFLAKDNARWNFVRIAAACCAAGFFGLLAMATLWLNRTSRVASVASLANGKVATSYAEDSAPASGLRGETTWAYDGDFVAAEGAGVSGPAVMSREQKVEAPPAPATDGEIARQGESLPSLYYLHDNVQYYPTPPIATEKSGSFGRGLEAIDLNRDVDGRPETRWADSGVPPVMATPRLLVEEEEERPQTGFEAIPNFGAPVEKAKAEALSTSGGMGGGMGMEDRIARDKSAASSPEVEAVLRQSVENGRAMDGYATGVGGQQMDAPNTIGNCARGEFEVILNESVAGRSFGEPVLEKKTEIAGIQIDLRSKDAARPVIAPESTNGLELGRNSYAGFDASSIADPESKVWKSLSSRRLERYGTMEDTKGGKAFAEAILTENSAAVEPFSTFSLHVSDVSFKLAQAALSRGEWPDSAKVRIEEFVNAFDYGDPMPSGDEKVACRVEQSVHPFLQQRNLLRVSMRTAAAGRASTTPLRITFLLDNSGSMERADRQQTVRRAFALLAQQLTPIDQVTLISFARQPRLLADKVNGAQSNQLVAMIDELPSEGGTNIEAALQLAFEKATEQQLDGAQNRIVLLTDGAVNLGDANPKRLSGMIASIRDAGIAFDAAGISAEGLNDEVLEALTRKGDGRYYLLDSAEAADDGFVRQIAGALRPSAKNVKVQVEFNPKRVGRYRLLGFEKHRLKQEDFRNDSVDAAEMAAAEAGVAVYQFETLPDGEGDVGSVSVRFRDLSTGEMVENRWPIPYEADAQRIDQATPSMNIATTAALFAAKLRGEPLGESVDLKTLSELIGGLPQQDRNAKRVQQLQSMINQARQVSGN